MAKDIFEQCLVDITEKLSKKITAKQKKAAINAIKTEIKNGANPNDLSGLVELVANRIKNDNAAKIKTKLIQANKDIELYTNVKKNFSDRPDLGISALMGNVSVNRPNAKAGITTIENAFKAKLVGGFISELEAQGLTKIAKSGMHDKEIAQLRAAMNKKDFTPPAKVTEEALTIAKLIKKYQDIASYEANRRGGNIGTDDNFFASRTHDQALIAKAGKAGWVANVREKLDINKTFPSLDSEQEIVERLGELWEQFSNGYHLSFENTQGFKGTSGVSGKVSQERVLHFKDADAEYSYFKEFSGENNLMSQVVAGLSGLSRDTAIMDVLGPDGIGSVDRLVDKLEKEMTKEGRGKEVDKLRKELKNIKENIYPSITGELAIPANGVIADVGDYVRGGLSTAQLGLSWLTAIPDAALGASAVRYMTKQDTKTFVNAAGNMLSDMLGVPFSALKNMGTAKLEKELRLAADQIGIIIESGNPFSGDTTMKGKFGRFMEFYFKANLLGPHTQNQKVSASRQVSNYYSGLKDKSFLELSAANQSTLKQYGIDEMAWNAIRNTKDAKYKGEYNVIDSRTFKDIPDSEIAKISSVQEKLDLIRKSDVSAEKKEQLIKTALKDGKSDIENKWRGFMNDVANISSSEPGAIERGIMLQGSQKGTYLGEGVRSFMQYKSFIITTMRRHMFREMDGYSANPKSFKDLLFAKDAGQDARIGMATMLSAGMMMGILSQSLRDIAKGQTPQLLMAEEPKDFGKLMAAGLARSGGLGFYGDFLFGDVLSNDYGQDPLIGLAGPTAGLISDTMKLAGSAKESLVGEGDFPEAKIIRYLKSYTPGASAINNHILTSYMANRLIFWQMQEWLNPGYLQRHEDNLKRNSNKEYLRFESLGIDLSPTSAVE